MTSPVRRTYTNDDLLRIGEKVTASPSCKVRRRLWFFGLLRKPNIPTDSKTQDSRSAPPEPRVPVPQLAPRNTPAENNHGSCPAQARRSQLTNFLSVATFNARTLSDPWRLCELAKAAEDLSISIVAVQEHRRTTDLDVQVGEGWVFKASPATQRGTGGIGFLLSPQAHRSLLSLEFPSDRIGRASFALVDRKLHLFCVYAPTAPATAADVAPTVQLYDQLGHQIDQFASRDLCLVAGDFNAPLPVDRRMVKNRCGNPNANAQHLATFMTARGLLAVNGYLRQRYSSLPTFYGPNGRKTRLDWILCSATWRSRLRTSRSFVLKCVPSDHALVCCRLNLRWKRFRRPTAKPHWGALADLQPKTAFVECLLNAGLCADSSYEEFVSAAAVAASSCLPKNLPRQSTARWASDHAICEARKRVQAASAKHGNDSEEAKAAVRELEFTHRSVAERAIQEAVAEIQAATDNCRPAAAWRAINGLTGRRAAPTMTIAAESLEQRKRNLAAHFERVLNAPPPRDVLPPLDDAPTTEIEDFDCSPIRSAEVASALKSMRAAAASGVDNIPVRVLKLPELLPMLTGILNRSCCLGGDASVRPPSQWMKSKIIAIPKKSNSKRLDDLRGVALECTLAKVLNAVLRNRLIPVLNKRLLNLQSGFRPGRSTTEQVAAIRCVVEACKTRQKSASIVFVDFCKAFDSISRPAIAWLLEQHGVPQLLVQAVMDFYDGSSAFVQTPDGPSPEFLTTSGVLQGDTLSPFLFVVIMDFVLRRTLQEEDGFIVANRRSSRHPAIRLTCLAYADDVALTCCDPAAAQRAVRRLVEEGERVGLRINLNKTKVLHIGTSSNPPLLLSNGESICVCANFTYLGVPVMNCDAILESRKQLAWRALYLLRSIFESAARDSLKIALFRSAVESVLSYGLEAVPMTESRAASLNGAYRRLLRAALGIHYPETVSNEELAARTRLPPFACLLQRRRAMLVGHCLRANERGEGPPLATLLLHPPRERLRRGQGRTVTLTSCLLSDLAELGLTPSEAARTDSAVYKMQVFAATA